MRRNYNTIKTFNTINWIEVNKYIKNIQNSIVEAYLNKNIKEVQRLQEILVKSFEARALAVFKVKTNQGYKTNGIDKYNLEKATDRELMSLINQLINNESYKAKPVRRIYIPKGNGKIRPLGIPTIYDRCMQQLYLFALAPIAEAKADEHSFGFRPARSTKDAIATLWYGLNYIVIKSKYDSNKIIYIPNILPRYVINADIKSFFDEISHKWIMDNIPINKMILEQFLNSGYIDKSKFYPTTKGVPQGGIISPTIANIVLDGLELEIRNILKRRKINVPLTYVRYADDFIIVVPMDWVIKPIMEVINKFIKLRGIRLSKEKLTIIDILKDPNGFKFLGVRFYRTKRTIKSKVNQFTVKQYKTIRPEWDKTKLLYVPDKIKVNNLTQRIKYITKDLNKTFNEILEEINPIIRGWGNYYVSTNASNIFRIIDRKVWWLVMNWAKKKHKLVSTKVIIKKYGMKISKKSHEKTSYFGIIKDNKKIILFRLQLMIINYHLDICKNYNYYDSNNYSYFNKRLKKYWEQNK